MKFFLTKILNIMWYKMLYGHNVFLCRPLVRNLKKNQHFMKKKYSKRLDYYIIMCHYKLQQSIDLKFICAILKVVVYKVYNLFSKKFFPLNMRPSVDVTALSGHPHSRPPCPYLPSPLTSRLCWAHHQTLSLPPFIVFNGSSLHSLVPFLKNLNSTFVSIFTSHCDPI